MLYLQVLVVLIAFAANSLFCRWALDIHQFDPALFTFIRLSSGALILSLLVRHTLRTEKSSLSANDGNTSHSAPSLKQLLSSSRFWSLGAGLLVYALGFSWAYTYLDTGIGAFILFATVQISMQVAAYFHNERLNAIQWLGIVISFAGLAWLLLPQSSPPHPASALMMFIAALGWTWFVVLGRQSKQPLQDVRNAFIAAALLMLPIFPFVLQEWLHWHWMPWLLALLSGTLASGLGYFLWYKILPELGLSKAAQFQLLVPIIALLLGAAFLSEAVSVETRGAMFVIIAGISLSAFQQKLSSFYAGLSNHKD